MFASYGIDDLVIFLFDINLKLKRKSSFEELYLDIHGIKISTDDKICFSYIKENCSHERIVVLNNHYKISKTIQMNNIFLNGVSENFIYLSVYDKDEVRIYDWSLNFTLRTGQTNDRSK